MLYRISNSYSYNKLISKNINIALLFVTLVSKDQESKKKTDLKQYAAKKISKLGKEIPIS